jgi:hypothetical protein
MLFVAIGRTVGIISMIVTFAPLRSSCTRTPRRAPGADHRHAPGTSARRRAYVLPITVFP